MTIENICENETLRPAITTGQNIMAVCPINAFCNIHDEDDEEPTVCGHFVGIVKEGYAWKVRCSLGEVK
jgi:hypothetical protein